MFRYGLARDLVEDRTDMAADVSLQGGGQAALRLGPWRLAEHVGAAVLDCMVHFFVYAWHFSPTVLLVCVAVHDRSPVHLTR